MGFESCEQNHEKWLHIFSDVPYKKICFTVEAVHLITVFYRAVWVAVEKMPRTETYNIVII